MIVHGVINKLERRPALEEGIQNMNETETKELIKIFQQFGIYRNSLSKEHDDFVKQQLQKKYDNVTKTYELQGKIYTGTFREDSHRKENKDAYKREAKLATVLASMGFDVILIEEDNTKGGKKPDAIVNGIVMDFKEIEALNENVVGKNSVGNRYQDGMKKKPTAGVAIFLHNFSNQYISKHMESKTKPSNNGLALFFHEDTGTLQLIDMKKIRTIHIEQSLKIGTPPRTSSEQRSLEGFNTSDEASSSSLQLNNISHSSKKSNQKSSEGRLNEKVSLSKPITIVVTQYDDKHNPITDNNGNPVTATLHCNKGLGVALGTLVHRNAVLERDNELLRKQLNMYKTNNISQADDSSWSD